jgi:SAM-dependent methyltransferase
MSDEAPDVQMDQSRQELSDDYDLVAEEYAAHLFGELAHKPFDRRMLDWLVEKVDGRGAICDLGCGPGQVAHYLNERGAQACGIDLSPAMIGRARELNPGITFQVGDMLDLSGVADESFGGVAAFYSIVHLPRASLVDALSEMQRVLRAGGALLVAFHVGSETVHREELFGKRVSLDFLFFETAEVKQSLTAAGFALEEVIERDPYPEVEYPSRRAYLFARKI